jgi:NAD(P)-dependent dehydrogenase (short-subunit alcohol dehydrogenase family)
MAYFNWLEDITDEEWDRVRREEVDLVFLLTRAAWPHLKASHGVIVNTASISGHIISGIWARWPTRRRRRGLSR